MWPPVILRLGQDGGDEVIKALWILLGVDRGDLCPCLEKGGAKKCHLVLALFMTYWNYNNNSLPLYSAILGTQSALHRRGNCVCNSYPMFDCLSCMGCFLLGIIWCENVNHRHEVNFFFRSICEEEWATGFKQELEQSETELSLACLLAQCCAATAYLTFTEPVHPFLSWSTTPDNCLAW